MNIQWAKPRKVASFLRTRTYPKVNLPHKKIGNRHGLGVKLKYILFLVDLPPASDRVTVMFSNSASRDSVFDKLLGNNCRFFILQGF